jgi:hypothetical protein
MNRKNCNGSKKAQKYKLYLGRLQIAFFSVSNEHQEQGVKVRDSRFALFAANSHFKRGL